MYITPSPSDAELNRRIEARAASVAASAARSRAKGTKRGYGLGPAQKRALELLKEKPLPPKEIARAIGQADYLSLVTTLGGLVHLGLIENKGGAWIAR